MSKYIIEIIYEDDIIVHRSMPDTMTSLELQNIIFQLELIKSEILDEIKRRIPEVGIPIKKNE